MASGGAGALLLRAAALGGLTAAAWLLGGTSASAEPEQPPAVEITVETPARAEHPARAEFASPVEVSAPAQALALSEDPAAWVQAFTASVVEKHQPAEFVPLVATRPDEDEPWEEEDPGPVLDFSGGSHGDVRSGSISNEAPPEVVQAKAQLRAARKAARLAAALPPPPAPPAPPAPVVVTKTVVPLLPDLPAPAPVKAEPAPVSDLNWSTPGPDVPRPAPQPAPVVATASASSGHTDNSGGTRGVLAFLTSHDSLFPPTTWSVEERRDGTSPGSVPGLPSTSPD
ncbi:hypothetical protein [Lentzea sp. CC55]|uniref:hypothetical protein n=1 Tax=Lentzea sp. CC55 TaxID=2884909 RepID=UPI001F22AC63|nr:hypothetical protein [Lentzea sp. CC55]MCG8925579.1 hypothetical protein [Lentzea sp. CC55]